MGRLIDADKLRYKHSLNTVNTTMPQSFPCITKDEINNVPTVEAIPKANVYKAVQEMMKYEHEGFINISLARLDEILKKCGVSEDGNDD